MLSSTRAGVDPMSSAPREAFITNNQLVVGSGTYGRNNLRNLLSSSHQEFLMDASTMVSTRMPRSARVHFVWRP